MSAFCFRFLYKHQCLHFVLGFYININDLLIHIKPVINSIFNCICFTNHELLLVNTNSLRARLSRMVFHSLVNLDA